MFDITSSKLLILGIVALLVIGPKDLPALLRTIGKYMGIIKRHAADFRAQFDDAIRESELEELKKDVEKLGTEAETTMREAEHSVDKEFAAASHDVDALMAPDADALPAAGATAPDEAKPALNGVSRPSEGAPEAAIEPETAGAGGPGGTPAKAGA